MGGMVLKFTSVVVRHLLGHLDLCLAQWLTLRRLIATPNSPSRGHSLPPAGNSPPTSPSPTSLYVHTTRDITVAVKNIAQISGSVS